jgi:Nif-specific ferredoxin III
MGMITGVTLGGEEYTPEFVVALDQSKCIGCGRCFKVCPRDVLDLVERDELELDDDDYDDDDGFDDDVVMVMTLKNPNDCIGCSSCSRICTKKCFTNEPQPKAA